MAVIASVPMVIVMLPAQLVVMDGGLHLSSSEALRSLVMGRWPELLTWRPGLPPNLTVELLLGATTRFVDPDVAIRSVVILALVGFALAAVVMVRAAGAPVWTALLVLPIQMNAMVMVGLLGFIVAVTPALLAVATVLRSPGRFSTTGVTALLVLTWLTHLVPALAGLVGVAAVVVAHELSGQQQSGVLKRSLWRLAVPAGGVLGLTLLFLLTGGTDGSHGASLLGGGLDVLTLRTPLIALARPEYALTRVLSVALYGATAVLLVRRWRRGPRRPVAPDGLLVAAVVLGLAAAVAPERIGSTSYVAGRLSIFLPIFLGAWIASGWTTVPERWARRAVALAATLAAVVALGLPLARVESMESLGADLVELRGLSPCVPSRSTIVQFTVDGGHERAARLAPTVDMSGYLAVERHLLDLRNVSGSASYYTWELTPGARPVPALTPVDEAFDEVPPDVALGAAVERGYPLQTVVVYGRRDASPEALDSPGWRRVEADLARDFRRVRATPTGLAELWVRDGLASPCG